MTPLRWISRWPLVVLTGALPTQVQEVVWADVSRWSEVLHWRGSRNAVLLRLFGHEKPEFRNLYYFRLRRWGLRGKVLARLLALRWPPLDSLFLHAGSIGPGLFIQHGFSTIVVARSIGANGWINQQVTLGHVGDRGAPILGDDVTIAAGAIVVGPVTIGNGATVGAGTTVVQDVPAGMTAVGSAMRLLPGRSDDTSVAPG